MRGPDRLGGVLSTMRDLTIRDLNMADCLSGETVTNWRWRCSTEEAVSRGSSVRVAARIEQIRLDEWRTGEIPLLPAMPLRRRSGASRSDLSVVFRKPDPANLSGLRD